MSRALLPWIAVLALGLLAALWWALGRERAGDDASRAREARAPAAPDVEPRLSTRAPSAGPREEAADPAAAAVDALAGDIGGEPAAALERLLVQVVAREDGAPVAYAELDWALLEGERARRSRDLAQVDALLADHGRSAQADAAGEARLPAPREGELLVVGGRRGALWGRAARGGSGEAEGPLRLELAPDFDVDVWVRAVGGPPPAGTPVALRWELHGQSDVLQARTDSDGRARLAHAGSLVARFGRHSGARWWIAAALPLAEPVRAPLDPDEPPLGPVVLELPALGSLEVVARTPGGAAPEQGEVELERVEADDGGGSRAFFRNLAPAATAELQGGVALFPAVGLGLELRARVSMPHAAVPTQVELHGPTRAGERARVEVALGSDHPVVRLRALDGDSRPLADVELVARVTLESLPTAFVPDAGPRRARTAADGVLELHLPSPRRDGDERRWGRAGAAAGSTGNHVVLLLPAADGRPPAEARVGLPDSLPDGVTDLGDVHLLPAPLLAQGRVVDEHGAPLPGARLEALAYAVRGGDPELDDLGIEARSDAEGRFELRARCSEPQALVIARGEGRGDVQQVCAPGTTGLVLRLERTGSLAGRVLGDDALPADALSVHVERPGWDDGEGPRMGSSVRLNSRSTTPRQDGAFEVDGLAAGVYDLLVRPRGQGEALLALEGLEVPAGGACADPRLAAIDLRGVARLLRIDLVPPDPEAEVRGFYRWRASDGEDWSLQLLRARRFELVAHAAPLEVEVHAFGHRPARLEDVHGDRTVHLVEGLRVRLRLPEGLRLPEAPYGLKASLRSPGDDSPWAGHFEPARFDARGELLLRAGSPGVHHVTFLMERGDAMGWTTWELEIPPQEITVVETPREQVFDVELTQEALDRAADSHE